MNLYQSDNYFCLGMFAVRRARWFPWEPQKAAEGARLSQGEENHYVDEAAVDAHYLGHGDYVGVWR